MAPTMASSLLLPSLLYLLLSPTITIPFIIFLFIFFVVIR
jgi:hypothetical protein